MSRPGGVPAAGRQGALASSPACVPVGSSMSGARSASTRAAAARSNGRSSRSETRCPHIF